MAVAHVSTASNVSGTGGTTLTISSFTVSGTDPVLIVHVGSNSPHNESQYPTSVSWSLGGGEALTLIEELRGGESAAALAQIWVRAAPTAGTGNVVVTTTFNDGRPWSAAAQCFSGSDQTTPCPAADATSSSSVSASHLITPANLTASDATAAVGFADFGAATSVSPNQRVLNNFNEFGSIAVGDNTGTTGVTFNGDGDWDGEHTLAAVRIVASAAAAADAGWVGPAVFRVRGHSRWSSV